MRIGAFLQEFFQKKSDMKVLIKRLNESAKLPTKAHESDAGFDLYATSRVFGKDGCATYGTGIAIEIPEGHVGLVFPRSSISRKDMMQTNSVSVIDSGYRGEIYVKFKPTLIYVDKPEYGIEHFSPEDYDGTVQVDAETQEVTFHGRNKSYPDVREGHLPFPFRAYEVGERIGQLIILPYPAVEWEETETLSESDRGEGGFGSSGK